LGRLPTPALAFHAFTRQKGSMMVTGSHIPADYNGYKTNTATGELRKSDEPPITRLVELVRTRLYDQPARDSLFDRQGRFKSGPAELSAELPEAREGYLRRYADFFAGSSLAGKRILVYQHSAVGRDLLVEMLRRFGAEAIPVGRCEEFVPIDTENVEPDQLARIQSLVNEAWATHGPLDAVVSTDGDSDRPMVFGLEAPTAAYKTSSPGCVRFIPGDALGMMVAEYLRADAVVVPITCNDAIDLGPLKDLLEPKTRIGSPFVIEGFKAAAARGRKAICGWEANGGFLTGSDIQRDDKLLRALPTRDAFLPILSMLFCATERKVTLCDLFDQLPKRFSRAGLLKKFPRQAGREIVQRFSPLAGEISEIRFQAGRVVFLNQQRSKAASSDARLSAAQTVRETLLRFFTPALGFDEISRMDYTDGVRIYFTNGDIAHVRPSGNADELRIYAVADTLARAEAIIQAGTAEPDGILRQLEQFMAQAA
jgi:phosphomannomutase